MKKQQFFISVPIFPTDKLEPVNYEYVGFPERNVNDKSNNCAHFPGVPMLIHNYSPEKEAQLVFIRTLGPQTKYAESNFELIKKEIAAIPDNPNIDKELREKFSGNRLLETAKEIRVEYTETYSRQLKSLKDLCHAFEEDAEIYMDITFGSKVTPLVSVSSLVYAENAKNCSLKELIYGKVAQSEDKQIFDVKAMYRMSQSLNLASFTSGMDLDELLESFNVED